MKEWWSGAHSVFENGSERVSALIFSPMSGSWAKLKKLMSVELWWNQTDSDWSANFWFLYNSSEPSKQGIIYYNSYVPYSLCALPLCINTHSKSLNYEPEIFKQIQQNS